MDALEDGELNFRFRDNSCFNRKLNRIRNIFEKQRSAHEQDAWTKLIKFVETYRELSGVARPVRKALVLDELVGQVIALNREALAEAGINCRYLPSEADLIIYADEGQISRQIMRNHNGSIELLRSNERETIFELIFI